MPSTHVRDPFALDAAKIHPSVALRTLLEAGWTQEETRSRNVYSLVNREINLRVTFINDESDPTFDQWYGVEVGEAIGAYAQQRGMTLLKAYGEFAKTQARMRGEGLLPARTPQASGESDAPPVQ